MEVLRLETLTKLARGLLAAEVDQELAEITADLEQRPGLKKPRKLVIEIQLTPVPDEDNPDALKSTATQFSVQKTLPKKVMKRSLRYIPKSRGLGFETDTDSIDHHPEQPVLGFEDDEESDD